jgi:uroporphyrinogen-III synthase
MALASWRLQRLKGTPVVRQLQRAELRSGGVPPGRRAAAATLLPLAEAQRSPWLTVGEGTARACGHTASPRCAPQRMDSEGLLALPVLAEVRACASAW